MSEPMALDRALALLKEHLPYLERVLSPELALALRTVFDAASGSALADVVREANRVTAKAQTFTVPHAYVASKFPENAELRICVECFNHVDHDIHRLDAGKTPHLYVGRSGGTCYLCSHPRDHDIHPNRSAP